MAGYVSMGDCPAMLSPLVRFVTGRYKLARMDYFQCIFNNDVLMSVVKMGGCLSMLLLRSNKCRLSSVCLS